MLIGPLRYALSFPILAGWLQTYQEHAATLRDHISKSLSSSQAEPNFVDAQWRLEVELGSRSLRESMRPSYLLRFDVRAPSATSNSSSDARTASSLRTASEYCSVDYATLQELRSQLNSARKRLADPTVQRIQRYIR